MWVPHDVAQDPASDASDGQEAEKKDEEKGKMVEKDGKVEEEKKKRKLPLPDVSRADEVGEDGRGPARPAKAKPMPRPRETGPRETDLDLEDDDQSWGDWTEQPKGAPGKKGGGKGPNEGVNPFFLKTQVRRGHPGRWGW